jgi:hypothetical protein
MGVPRHSKEKGVMCGVHGGQLDEWTKTERDIRNLPLCFLFRLRQDDEAD